MEILSIVMAESAPAEKISHKDYRWKELSYGLVDEQNIDHFLLEGEVEKCRLTSHIVQYIPMLDIIGYTCFSFGLFLILYICNWSYVEKMFDNRKMTVILTNKRIIAVDQVDGGNGFLWKRPHQQIIRHFPVKDVVSLTKACSKTHEHAWFLRCCYGQELVEYSELWIMFNFFSQGGKAPAAVHKAAAAGKFDSKSSTDIREFQKEMGKLVADATKTIIQQGLMSVHPAGWIMWGLKILYYIFKLIYKFMMNVGGIEFFVETNPSEIHFLSAANMQEDVDKFAAAIMEAVEINTLDDSKGTGPTESVSVSTTQEGPLIGGDGISAVPIINIKKLCLPIGETVQDIVQFVYEPTFWEWVYTYWTCGIYWYFYIRPKLLLREALVRTSNRLVQLKSIEFKHYDYEMATYYLKMQPACVISVSNTPAKNTGSCFGLIPDKLVYACFVLTTSGSYGYIGYEKEATISRVKAFFYPFLKQSMKGTYIMWYFAFFVSYWYYRVC